MSPVPTHVVSNELEVPPTINEVRKRERRELMISDRKASKVLGVTVLRAPRLVINQKASRILGTNVVRSGVDWEMRFKEGSVYPRKSKLREKFLTRRIAPLVLGGVEKRGEVSENEGWKVVLSPRRKSSRMLRRHTISWEPGLSPTHPPPPSPVLIAGTPGSAAQTPTEPLSEGGEERSGLNLDLGTGFDGTETETPTLVDRGVVPFPGSGSCPPSPVEPLPPLQPHEERISPAVRGDPVLQKRREMIRSANKSVQILGIEARRAILKKMEEANAGRIGWPGV
jgi:hypothetical protein